MNQGRIVVDDRDLVVCTEHGDSCESGRSTSEGHTIWRCIVCRAFRWI